MTARETNDGEYVRGFHMIYAANVGRKEEEKEGVGRDGSGGGGPPSS